MITIIQHDGKNWLLQDVLGDNENRDDFDVCVIEVTSAVIAEWRQRLHLAGALQTFYRVDEIAFYDIGMQFFAADHDAEPIHGGPDAQLLPAWDKGPGVTNRDRVVFTGCGAMYHRSGIKHSDQGDIVTSYGYDLAELDEIEALLKEMPCLKNSTESAGR